MTMSTSPIRCSHVACGIRKVSLTLILMSQGIFGGMDGGSPCRMSILRNVHVAVSNVRVEGLISRNSHL